MAFLTLQQAGAFAPATVDPAEPVIDGAAFAAWCEADAMLDVAHREAQRIRDEAQAAFDVEQRRGYEDGLRQAQFEQAERMIEHASRMVDHFAAIEGRMVMLVMQAVRRIVSDFTDSERVLAVVRNGLAVMRTQKQLTLRLAPDVVETVKARATELLEAFPGVGMLDFVPDSRLKGDAAILESEIGVVEASIETQLQAIEQAFNKILGSRV